MGHSRVPDPPDKMTGWIAAPPPLFGLFISPGLTESWLIYLYERFSGVATHLAPQPELFLHHPIGKAEQHRLPRGVVRVARPARHDKNVVLLPAKHRVADPGFALALDAD